MATVRITNVLNPAQIAYILKSPAGPTARDLIKRGVRVQTRARRNLSGNTGSGPKRVDTGLLRASIATQLRVDLEGLVMRVGTGVRYARWIHDGTGIYGPKARMIKPKQAKYMRWYNKQGTAVFARQTKGMKPNPFLRNALPAYRASSSA